LRVHNGETIQQHFSRRFLDVGVALVRWPSERQRLERLRLRHSPRLLLIEEGTPPEVADCLEDWVRIPVEDVELALRADALEIRARQHGSASGPPALDGDGVLRVGSDWVSLPPVEARLTAVLLDRAGTVVGRESLAKAGWPEGAPGRNALDVHVLRLRRRLGTVGLAIRTVRSRGYLLEGGEPSDCRQDIVNPP
jgi:Transcriptional regulatory protein, C terminal